jgi:hypothetical protein
MSEEVRFTSAIGAYRTPVDEAVVGGKPAAEIEPAGAGVLGAAAAPPPATGAGGPDIPNLPVLPEPRLTTRGGELQKFAVRMQDLGPERGAMRAAQLAMVIMESNQLARESARADRAAARDQDIAAQEAAAEKIRSGAAFQLVAGCVTSGMGIIGGATSFVGARKSQSAFDAEMKAPAADANAALTNSYRAQQAAQQATMKWSGTSTIVSEAGKIIGSGFNFAASEEEAQKAELETEATKARTRAEDQSDFMQSYKKSVDDVLGVVSELIRAEAEAGMRAASMG